MSNLVVNKNLFDEHMEHFEDHFICDEQINGLISYNQIRLLT